VTAVRIGVRPPATVAGARAVLDQAAAVLRGSGWAQYQADDPHGRVCLHRAVDLAAEHDSALAYEVRGALVTALRLVFGHQGVDVVTWNDHDGRSLAQVLTLLRVTRAALVPAGAVA
jgi:hypothetical protein